MERALAGREQRKRAKRFSAGPAIFGAGRDGLPPSLREDGHPRVVTETERKPQIPFGWAQGRLSTSLGMTSLEGEQSLAGLSG